MSVLDGALVFVDIETTGVSHTRGRIIEVAAVRVENRQMTKVFNSLVDPQADLPMFITELTGITRADLQSAPTFYDIAEELAQILDGAVFVAHNVRFDYGFLKQEFKRVGRQFNPKQLCTVRLSRALYPDVRGHKLQNIIERCDIKVTNRHRAYDDAKVMWQFIQHVEASFPAKIIEGAIGRQIKTPSLPKALSPALVKGLPEGCGVYIFEDETGAPLYIGKSVNIKKRVLSHFSADHKFESEFKISQQIAHIQTVTTNGELEALLLESQLIKDRQPLYNRQLRRHQKLTLARQSLSTDGYLALSLEDTSRIDPETMSDILGVYTTKSKAREFINQITKDFGLCPKLMGFEKGRGACFSHQLKRCQGACAGKESPADYNQRLLSAFEGRRLQEWPYRSAIAIEEKTDSQTASSIIIDQWCVVANVYQEPDCEPIVKFQDKMFDIDTYKILRTYLSAKPHKLKIRPISLDYFKQSVLSEVV